jgi:predicted ATPase/DNA-binding SARP family transcriptional activator
MTQLRLYVFGPPRLERGGQPIDLNLRKALALCVYLAVSRQPHSRDALATLFWPDNDQREARTSLRRTLHRLTQAIGDDILLASADTVMLDPSADLWVDAAAFERLAAGDDPAAAAALYRDDFLAGFTLPDSPAFDEWQFFECERLRQLFTRLLTELVTAAQSHGDWPAAASYARHWVALDPLHEPAQRALIAAYAQAGHTAAALRQYQELARMLQAELDAEPEEETAALAEAVRSRRIAPPAAPEQAPGAPPTSTAAEAPPRADTRAPPPAPLAQTPLVGRERELAEILQLLTADDTGHLLTIIGPGGTGKTRLAQAVAEQAQAHFAHGACVVSLAEAAGPRALAGPIAGAIGLPLASTDMEADLLAALRTRELLLVLDNFEHLLERADLATGIVAAAPRVRVLVTSRERLSTSGEIVYTLGGLALPVDDTPAAALASEAVQLLLQQARLVGRLALPGPDEIQALARICRLVQGMPLALTLAARWAEVLSFAEIAEEIGRSLDILASDLHDLPPRQRSVRAVFDASWQRLSPPMQQIFVQLTVFRGGFTRQAAEEVAGADLRTLRRLANSSFLMVNTQEQRYTLHELLRQFAAEHLSGPLRTGAEERHSAFYLDLLERLAADLKGGRQQQALGRLAADRDNLHAAWRWAARQGRHDLIGAAAEGLWLFYERYGDAAAGEAAFAEALAGLEAAEGGAGDGLAGLLLAAQGHFHARRSAFTSGRELMERGVARMRAAPAGLPLGLALVYLGFLSHYQGRYAEAERLGEESLALFAEADDRWGVALSLQLMGTSLARQGRPVLAQQLLHTCLEMARAAGAHGSRSFAAWNLARVLAEFGDYAAAQRFLEEAMAAGQQAGYRLSVASALCERALLALDLGDFDTAERDFTASVELYTAIGSAVFAETTRAYTGLLARMRGDLDVAEALLWHGLEHSRVLQNHRDEALFLGELALVAQRQGDLRRAVRLQEDALAIWRAVGNEPGIAAASGVLATLQGALDAPAAVVEELSHTALDLALRHRLAPVALAAFIGLAPLLAAAGAAGEALELLALAEQHSAATAETRGRAAALAERIAAGVTAETVAAARRRGAGLDWRAVAKQLLRQKASDTSAEPRPAPTNLDPRLPPLIGRDWQLAELVGLLNLPARRLVTLHGPGGIGKTRLAQEAGLAALEHFPDGTWFVALAPLSSPDQIAGAIAEALGFRPGGAGEPREQLLGYLREKRLLLILDNFEHLLEGAGLLADLLRLSPQVTLLVTSRERLNLAGEIVVPVRGIEVPPDEADEQAMERGAVKLLLQQARLARPELELTPPELDAVIRICRMVDGMPLALILAASWADMLSFAVIAAEIARSLDFLEGELRDLPPRQRSVRAVFDASSQRLPAAAQRVFARLSVFRGGFTREAAAQVAGADLRALRVLLNSSFVVAEPGERYGLHELLRQYAAEKLDALGESAATIHRHSDYFLRDLCERSPDLKGRRQIPALLEIEADLENIRLAWTTALDRSETAAIGAAAEALYLFFDLRSRQREGSELFSAAGARLRAEAPGEVWARVAARYWVLASFAPDPKGQGEAELQRCLAIAEAANNDAEAAFCQRALGFNIARAQQDPARSLPHSERSLYRYSQVGDQYYVSDLLIRVGWCHMTMSGIEYFNRFARQSLEVARSIGNRVGEGIALSYLTEISVLLGRYAQAEAFADGAIVVAGETDRGSSRGNALIWLGLARLLYGELSAARELAVEVAIIASRLNNAILHAIALGLQGLSAGLSGNPALGRRLADESLAGISNPLGRMLAGWARAIAASSLQCYAEARQALREALRHARQMRAVAPLAWLLPVFALTLAQGGDPESATRLLALASTHQHDATGWINRWPPLATLRAQLEEALGPAAFATAWEHGAALDIHSVAAELAGEAL